jgi:hypothetical protein
MLYTIYSPDFLTYRPEINLSPFQMYFKLVTTLLYCFFWQILIFALFFAVMFDAYRRIIIQRGEPEKGPLKPKQAAFSFLLWSLSWLPKRLYMSLVQWIRKKQTEKKPDEVDQNRA